MHVARRPEEQLQVFQCNAGASPAVGMSTDLRWLLWYSSGYASVVLHCNIKQAYIQQSCIAMSSLLGTCVQVKEIGYL